MKIRGGFSSRNNSYWSMGDNRDRGYSFRGDRYGSSSRSYPNEYRRPYRENYSERDRRIPDYKRMRMEAPNSRHDTYGGYGSSRYETYPDRRGYSSDHHSGSVSRRHEFRRPLRSAPPPPRSPKSGYRGRLNTRGMHSLRTRERPVRRRLLPSSYAVNKRLVRGPNISRRLNINKLRSTIARRIALKKEKDESEVKETNETKESNETEIQQEKPIAESSPKKEKDESTVKNVEEDINKKALFIKLVCTHCNTKKLTFRKYDLHLNSRVHMLAMKKIAIKQKGILRQMRLAQRNTQGEIEKTAEDLTTKTNFCPLCKLIYKQEKSVHQNSEGHKNMRKFLMPSCTTCNKVFKSPMIYENHCCSIAHIMMKQTLENGENSGEDDDLKNFTTIDSVGEGEECDEKKEEPVGVDHIRVLQPHYCDLCKVYLTRGDEEEAPDALETHCKQRTHKSRFLRFKREQERTEMKKKIVADKKVKETDVKSESVEVKLDKEEEDEDKIWDEVDKDLGEIIADGDEDEDDSHVDGERYDRFKLSVKNEEEEPSKKVETETAVKEEIVKDN